MDETPTDAFGVLGNDTRVAILEALAEATEPGYGQQAVRFSDIRERVGVDDSGRLNYHLDKLRGLLALENPTVERSLERQGVDPSAPYWTLPVCVSPEHTAIDSREPWRIVLEVTPEGDGPRVVFDGDASVRDVRASYHND